MAYHYGRHPSGTIVDAEDDLGVLTDIAHCLSVIDDTLRPIRSTSDYRVDEKPRLDYLKTSIPRAPSTCLCSYADAPETLIAESAQQGRLLPSLAG